MTQLRRILIIVGKLVNIAESIQIILIFKFIINNNSTNNKVQKDLIALSEKLIMISLITKIIVKRYRL